MFLYSKNKELVEMLKGSSTQPMKKMYQEDGQLYVFPAEKCQEDILKHFEKNKDYYFSKKLYF